MASLADQCEVPSKTVCLTVFMCSWWASLSIENTLLITTNHVWSINIYYIQIMGRGGLLVYSTPIVWKVVGSNSALAYT